MYQVPGSTYIEMAFCINNTKYSLKLPEYIKAIFDAKTAIIFTHTAKILGSVAVVCEDCCQYPAN